MYYDHILLLIGTIFFVTFLCLIVYLIIGRKRSRMFSRVLKSETEAFEAINTTIKSHTTIRLENFTDSVSNIPNPNEDLTVAETGNIVDSTIVDNDFADTDVTVIDNMQVASHTMKTVAQTDFTFNPEDYGLSPIKDFNPEILKGQYVLLGEIGGGGMSRVFLARKVNTGNNWIVKYVATAIGDLGNEADILKTLNHINLPHIIDIFHDETGLYIVQTYVEGVGLDKVSSVAMHESIVTDWALQLGQVLSYLHKQGPILHLDLKPSNIIVTHDNKLVLIDFGISRRNTDPAKSIGLTLRYAAPEQFSAKISSKAVDVIKKRFGNLPEERYNWNLDERTDIFSYGVVMFEMATGVIPTHSSLGEIKKYASPSMCNIILKCLKINPSERYQSIDELLVDLQAHNSHTRPLMLKTLLVRKMAKYASAASIVFAIAGFSAGMLVMQQELQAQISVDPHRVILSLHESSELDITRFLGDNPRNINHSNITWEHSNRGIVQVDGIRIHGMSLGDTIINGRYRNSNISMPVTVVEPIHGMVDISMRFRTGRVVELFAGTEERVRVDGVGDEVEFVSPQSMAITESGIIYLADSGRLRRLENSANGRIGIAETVNLQPAFLRVQTVRTYGEDVYILTTSWVDENDEDVFAIYKLTENGNEQFYFGNLRFTEVRDFYVANEQIFIIERNYATGRTQLLTINTQDRYDRNVLIELPEHTSVITVGGGRVFLADTQNGIISYYDYAYSLLQYMAGFDNANNTLNRLAGIEGSLGFIDGVAPLFYRPTALRYHENSLYVWDFNTLRKIEFEEGVLTRAISVAGIASPVYDLDFTNSELAEEIILPFSYLTDFVHTSSGILLSDPKRGVIWNVRG